MVDSACACARLSRSCQRVQSRDQSIASGSRRSRLLSIGSRMQEAGSCISETETETESSYLHHPCKQTRIPHQRRPKTRKDKAVEINIDTRRRIQLRIGSSARQTYASPVSHQQLQCFLRATACHVSVGPQSILAGAAGLALPCWLPFGLDHLLQCTKYAAGGRGRPDRAGVSRYCRDDIPVVGDVFCTQDCRG
ncbi:hypothetical protein BDV19DRAFT_360621 [Aspergillus venezuelensis]